MLVDANTVEADALGIFELVEIFVVSAVADLRVEQARGHIDPYGTIIVLEGFRQLRIGHEMEPVEFHAFLPFTIVARFERSSWH
jgi:hypothetical protein